MDRLCQIILNEIKLIANLCKFKMMRFLIDQKKKKIKKLVIPRGKLRRKRAAIGRLAGCGAATGSLA